MTMDWTKDKLKYQINVSVLHNNIFKAFFGAVE